MRVALVTCDAARDHDEDLPLLAAALAARGATAELPSWDDPAVAWESFGAVVLRSPWNYMDRHEAFLAWVRATAAVAPLWNPPDLVAWALDKRYLGDLAARGVPTVPTVFAAPGEDPVIPDGEVVVKPSVGAGSMDALRCADAAAARAHVAHLHASGRTAMVQPYLDGVDASGETGLVHIAGRLTHAFRKGPMLAGPKDVVGGIYLEEDISAREPTPAERALAAAALAAVPGPVPLYARVDVVPGPGGDPVVLELELVEPSLFVALSPAAADAFAESVTDRIADTRRSATTGGAPSSR
ncbi:MAG: hypothetical protein IT200_01415 [Thermoleophilia bacterium]|nr:hypothetical protein [Thermoleophilia bacterium]